MLTAMLVGLGKIGMLNDLNHPPNSPIETLAKAFSLCPSCDLVSAVDFDEGKRRLFEGKYHIQSYPTIQEAIKFRAPDIVIIATPTNSHAEVFSNLLMYSRPKVVLCEKPLSYNRLDGLKIAKLSQKFNVPVLVNYMRRTDSSIIKAKDLIEEKKINGPFKGIGWYSKGIFNNGSHLIDLFQYFFGEIQECKAIRKPILIRDYGDMDIDIFLKFNDAELYLLATRDINFQNFSFNIHCNEGTFDYDNKKLTWNNRLPSKPMTFNTIKSFVQDTDSPKLYLNVAVDVCNFVNEKPSVLPSLETTFQIVDFLEGMKEENYVN